MILILIIHDINTKQVLKEQLLVPAMAAAQRKSLYLYHMYRLVGMIYQIIREEIILITTRTLSGHTADLH